MNKLEIGAIGGNIDYANSCMFTCDPQAHALDLVKIALSKTTYFERATLVGEANFVCKGLNGVYGSLACGMSGTVFYESPIEQRLTEIGPNTQMQQSL